MPYSRRSITKMWKPHITTRIWTPTKPPGLGSPAWKGTTTGAAIAHSPGCRHGATSPRGERTQVRRGASRKRGQGHQPITRLVRRRALVTAPTRIQGPDPRRGRIVMREDGYTVPAAESLAIAVAHEVMGQLGLLPPLDQLPDAAGSRAQKRRFTYPSILTSSGKCAISGKLCPPILAMVCSQQSS